MNKPRPWKCPWTSSKKRKKRTKNENTAMNEQAKVDGKLKLRLSGIKPAKDRVESFNWQRRFNDSTCSFWLACLLLSNPTCFSPTSSADWLTYLRTQLTVFVGEVCLRSRKIFSALFSRNNFFTRRGHFKELQVKRNLFDCSQILTVASFAYKQQRVVSELFISKYFFSRAIFVRSIHIFLILFQKCSVTFHWNWIWQIADTLF